MIKNYNKESFKRQATRKSESKEIICQVLYLSLFCSLYFSRAIPKIWAGAGNAGWKKGKAQRCSTKEDAETGA